MRAGITMLLDEPGSGPLVQRQHTYRVRLRMWLHKGDAVKWSAPWGQLDRARLEDDGLTLVTDLRLDRVNLPNGLFYGMEGMRVGGTRKLRIAPHLAYGERGIPGSIPANALVIAEVQVIEERVLGG